MVQAWTYQEVSKEKRPDQLCAYAQADWTVTFAYDEVLGVTRFFCSQRKHIVSFFVTDVPKRNTAYVRVHPYVEEIKSTTSHLLPSRTIETADLAISSMSSCCLLRPAPIKYHRLRSRTALV